MISRWRSSAACAALATALSLGGCNEFDAVGMLARDGEAPAANPDAAKNPGSPNAGDAGSSLVTIDDCRGGAAGLDETTVAALLQGGEGQTMRWLYPYDGTVFPGGLAAPLLMWDDGAIAEDAVYVHMHSSSFDYEGCMKPTGPAQLQLPQQVWATAGAGTSGAAAPFTIELRLLSSGRILTTGPTHVIVATGMLSGSVYYMTVGTGLATIDRVQPGLTAQPYLATLGCVGCHSVSSEGSRLIATVSGAGDSYTRGGVESRRPERRARSREPGPHAGRHALRDLRPSGRGRTEVVRRRDHDRRSLRDGDRPARGRQRSAERRDAPRVLSG